jgi:hypothetical protein
MVANAERFKAMLLEVVDKLFLIVKTEAGQPKITIHPSLSNDELDKLVNQTRDIIVQLYLGCERDFYTGMKLLRVIIEEKMQETMEAALSALKTETKTAVKNISKKQFLKNENEAARKQEEIQELQQFQNPIFDQEMQKAKAEEASKRYDDKRQIEFEIKQLEQNKAAKENEKVALENKLRSYETQKNTAGSDDLKKSADEKINSTNELIATITTQIQEDSDAIAEKREKLASQPL